MVSRIVNSCQNVPVRYAESGRCGSKLKPAPHFYQVPCWKAESALESLEPLPEPMAESVSEPILEALLCTAVFYARIHVTNLKPGTFGGRIMCEPCWTENGACLHRKVFCSCLILRNMKIQFDFALFVWGCGGFSRL